LVEQLTLNLVRIFPKVFSSKLFQSKIVQWLLFGLLLFAIMWVFRWENLGTVKVEDYENRQLQNRWTGEIKTINFMGSVRYSD